jgi:hypothetical protein
MGTVLTAQRVPRPESFQGAAGGPSCRMRMAPWCCCSTHGLRNRAAMIDATCFVGVDVKSCIRHVVGGICESCCCAYLRTVLSACTAAERVMNQTTGCGCMQA